jgi:hypothetical protein
MQQAAMPKLVDIPAGFTYPPIYIGRRLLEWFLKPATD